MGADDEQERGFKKASPIKAAKREVERADMSTWRTKLRQSRLKFDDVQKGIYLNVLRKTGERGTASKAAGVSLDTVLRHKEADPEFADAWAEALEDYKDFIHKHAVKVSVTGVKKPLLGGKDKDQVVAHEVIYATNILAMEMKRTDAEYKDRQEIDLKQTGSVLVAPAEMTPAEWIKQQTEKNKAKKEPGVDEK